MKKRILALTSKNKKALLVLTILIVILAITLSFAFVSASIGASVSTEVSSEGTERETLVFNTSNAIDIELSSDTFGDGADNVVNEITSSVTLTAPDDNEVSSTYSVYLYLENEFVYSVEDSAELVLSITDPNNNVIAVLDDFNYVTVNGVSGFDVTEHNGVIVVELDRVITTDLSEYEEWTFTLTLIAHEYDQSINLGAKLNLYSFVQTEDLSENVSKYGVNIPDYIVGGCNVDLYTSYVGAVNRDDYPYYSAVNYTYNYSTGNCDYTYGIYAKTSKTLISIADNGTRSYVYEGNNEYFINESSTNNWVSIVIQGSGSSSNYTISEFQLCFSDGYCGYIQDAVNDGYIEPLYLYESFNCEGTTIIAAPLTDFVEYGDAGEGRYHYIYNILKVKDVPLSSIKMTSSKDLSQTYDGYYVYQFAEDFDISLVPFE